MNGIKVENVSKRFGSVVALDNVSMMFEENRIYGLLGRNGAGKSTLLNIIANRLFADDGTVTIDGENACENDAAQSKLYYMSEKTLYPEKMSVKDAFMWSGRFYKNFDMDYALNLAKKFELNTKSAVRSLSTGYLSIFKIIVALASNVPYVLLDEPVLGLDANHRELFYRLLIEKYSEKPFTCVISTHLIEEVSGVIEHTVIVKNGRVIRDAEVAELLEGGYCVSGAMGAIDEFIKGKNVIGCEALGGLKSAYILGTLGKNERLALPAGVEAAPMDLQKLFIELTNE